MHCEHWLSLKALQNHLIQTVKGNHEQCFPLLQLTNTYKIHQANAKLCLTSQKNVDVWWKKESRRYMTYKLNKLQETILLLLHRMKWRKDQCRRGRWLKDQDRWEWDPLCVTKKTVGLKIMMDIHKVIKHMLHNHIAGSTGAKGYGIGYSTSFISISIELWHGVINLNKNLPVTFSGD